MDDFDRIPISSQRVWLKATPLTGPRAMPLTRNWIIQGDAALIRATDLVGPSEYCLMSDVDANCALLATSYLWKSGDS